MFIINLFTDNIKFYDLNLETRRKILNLGKLKSNLKSLPIEVFITEIVPHLTYQEFQNLCSSVPSFENICDDPYVIAKLNDNRLLFYIINYMPEVAIYKIRAGYNRDLPIALVLAVKYDYFDLVKELIKPEIVIKMDLGPNIHIDYNIESQENTDWKFIQNSIMYESALSLAIKDNNREIFDILMKNPQIRSLFVYSSYYRPDGWAIEEAAAKKDMYFYQEILKVIMENYDAIINYQNGYVIKDMIDILIKRDDLPKLEYFNNTFKDFGGLTRLNNYNYYATKTIQYNVVDIYDYINEIFSKLSSTIQTGFMGRVTSIRTIDSLKLEAKYDMAIMLEHELASPLTIVNIGISGLIKLLKTYNPKFNESIIKLVNKIPLDSADLELLFKLAVAYNNITVSLYLLTKYSKILSLNYNSSEKVYNIARRYYLDNLLKEELMSLDIDIEMFRMLILNNNLELYQVIFDKLSIPMQVKINSFLEETRTLNYNLKTLIPYNKRESLIIEGKFYDEDNLTYQLEKVLGVKIIYGIDAYEMLINNMIHKLIESSDIHPSSASISPIPVLIEPVSYGVTSPLPLPLPPVLSRSTLLASSIVFALPALPTLPGPPTLPTLPAFPPFFPALPLSPRELSASESDVSIFARGYRNKLDKSLEEIYNSIEDQAIKEEVTDSIGILREYKEDDKGDLPKLLLDTLYEKYNEGYEFYYFAFFSKDYKGLLCREPVSPMTSRLAAIELTPQNFEIGSGGPLMNIDHILWDYMNEGGDIRYYNIMKFDSKMKGFILGWTRQQLKLTITRLFNIDLCIDMRSKRQYDKRPKYSDFGITHKNSIYREKSKMLPLYNTSQQIPILAFYRLYYRYFMGVYDYYDWPHIKTNKIYSDSFVNWVAEHFYFINNIRDKTYEQLIDEISARAVINVTRSRPLTYPENQRFYQTY